MTDTPPPRSHEIAFDSVTLHWLEWGVPDAPPLVLLHALGEDAHSWDEVVPAFAETHRVFAIDQRGHGESSRPGTYTFPAMRDDLAAFVDALGLERFALVGHSMGGAVATLFAERSPERLTRLLLEDTAPPSAAMGMPRMDVPPAEAPGPVPFDWPVVPQIVAQSNDPDPAWWDELPRLTMPVLIIGGGETRRIGSANLRAAADCIPGSRLEVIEGAGHHVHVAAPAAYLEYAIPFLREDLPAI